MKSASPASASAFKTHTHADHLDAEFILSRHADYGTKVSGDLLLGASIETLQAIDKLVRQRSDYGSIFEPDTQAALHIGLVPVTPFETYRLGDYRITGYPANHGNDQEFLLYSIAQGDYAVFYGTDTSVLFDEVWIISA